MPKNPEKFEPRIEEKKEKKEVEKIEVEKIIEEEKLEKAVKREKEEAVEEHKESESFQSRLADKRFKMPEELQKEVLGYLAEEKNNIHIRAEREWLKEQLKDNPERFPEFAGLREAEIDKLDPARITQSIIGSKEFGKYLSKNKEWNNVVNLEKGVKEQKENLGPRYKALIFKRLPESTTKEKVWEKITGQKLDELVIEEAGIGLKSNYIEKGLADYSQRLKIDPFKKEWEFLSDEEKRRKYQNRIEIFADKKLKEQIGDKLKRLKVSVDPETLYGICKDYLPEIKIRRRGLRKEVIFSRREKKGEVCKEIVRVKDIKKFLEKKRNDFLKGREDEEIICGKIWDLKFETKKREVLEREAERMPAELIAKSYEEIEKDQSAKILAKEIEKSPKLKEKMEKELGREDLAKEALKAQERITGDLEEDQDIMREVLAKSGLEISKEKLGKVFDRMPEVEKASYGKVKERKFGFLEWLLILITAILAKEVKGSAEK